MDFEQPDPQIDQAIHIAAWVTRKAGMNAAIGQQALGLACAYFAANVFVESSNPMMSGLG